MRELFCPQKPRKVILVQSLPTSEQSLSSQPGPDKTNVRDWSFTDAEVETILNFVCIFQNDRPTVLCSAVGGRATPRLKLPDLHAERLRQQRIRQQPRRQIQAAEAVRPVRVLRWCAGTSGPPWHSGNTGRVGEAWRGRQRWQARSKGRQR